MNKQELIENYQNFENILDDIGARVACKHFLKDLEQLDEPKPVKVPQFVADWIEEAKRTTYNIREAIEMAQDVRVKDWLELKNVDIFAEAWVNGYEVEKEKRYTVVTKATKQPLYYNAMDKKLFFSMGGLATKFTRKQLEDADFGWVFDCEGIEIEEVE